MSDFEVPTPPNDLINLGQEWAFDHHYSQSRDEVSAELARMYSAGIAVFMVNRQAFRRQVEIGGGIAETKYVDNWDDWNRNYANVAILNSGQQILVSDALNPKELVLGTSEFQPVENGGSYTQTHTIQLRFGTPLTGKMETSDHDLDHTTRERVFELLLSDEAFFPNDVGIIEKVTTSVPSALDVTDEFDRDYVIPWTEERTAANAYSVGARIWRPSFGGHGAIPNPWHEPEAYHRWVLAGGNVKIDTYFQTSDNAVSSNQRGQLDFSGMKTVIDDSGNVLTNTKTALSQLEHFFTTLRYYTHEVFPDLFTDTSFAAQPQALEAASMRSLEA